MASRRVLEMAFALGFAVVVAATVAASGPAARPSARIAFVRGGSIYAVNPDGTGGRLLAEAKAFLGFTSVTWSPDGRRLAAAGATAAAGGGIWVMNGDGNHQMRVATVPFLPSRPSWSPDGRRIAFARPPAGRGFWIAQADGSGVRHVAVGGRLARTGVAAVDWSPLGNRFAVTAGGGWTLPGSGIYLVPASRASARDLTHEVEQVGPAEWSPDARTIVYTRTSIGEPRGEEIWVVDSASGARRQLTTNHVPDYDPAWSPDGSKIVFGGAYSGAGSGEIYVINADGSNFTRLTHQQGSEASPSWQPNGI